jgi:polyferredoxin
MGGLGMNWAVLSSGRGLAALAALGLFIALVALLGQSWCGWTCPFGLVQDYAARLRNKLRIREAIFTERTMAFIKTLKYVCFGYLVSTPVLITLGAAHPDLSLPYCAICPVKLIMPLLTGDTTYLNLDFTNPVLLTTSVVLMIFSGLVLVGMFFKTRFFCLLCPMSVLIGLFRPLYLLRVLKRPQACLGCGNCRRVCPADIDKTTPAIDPGSNCNPALVKPVTLSTSGCQGCFNCAQCCATDGSLAIKYGPWAIFNSSRRYAARFLKGRTAFFKALKGPGDRL